MLMTALVLAFALDALDRHLASILNRLGVAGESIPAAGAVAGMLLGWTVFTLMLDREMPVGTILRFLRMVVLLVCAVLLMDPVTRILLHLLSPDFATSKPALVLRLSLVLAAVGGLALIVRRLQRSLKSEAGSGVPPPPRYSLNGMYIAMSGRK